MSALLGAPVIAFSFLTVLPLRTSAVAEAAFPRAVMWFPVVGFAVGAVVALVDRLLASVLPTGVIAALDLAALAAATGGLHLDGLADSADGLLLHGDRSKRLAAMRDPGVGAFGIGAMAFVLLVEYGALTSMSPADRGLALVAGATLARWSMSIALLAFPYARPSGAGSAFKRGLLPADVLVATVLALIVVAFVGYGAWIAAIASALVTVAIGAAATAKLGGATGDVYGAIGELAFAATLILWTAYL